MTIAGRLKTETAAAHDRLDAGLDLLQGRERHAAAVTRFWGFYAGLGWLEEWCVRCDALVAACRDPEALDDATVLVLRRV